MQIRSFAVSACLRCARLDATMYTPPHAPAPSASSTPTIWPSAAISCIDGFW